MLYCSNQFISSFEKPLDDGHFSKIRKSSPESIFFIFSFEFLGTITYCSENIFPNRQSVWILFPPEIAC